MKLHNHFTGAAQLLDTSLLLICWTFHTITWMQYLYIDQSSLKISHEGDSLGIRHWHRIYKNFIEYSLPIMCTYHWISRYVAFSHIFFTIYETNSRKYMNLPIDMMDTPCIDESKCYSQATSSGMVWGQYGSPKTFLPLPACLAFGLLFYCSFVKTNCNKICNRRQSLGYMYAAVKCMFWVVKMSTWINSYQVFVSGAS